MKIEIIKQIHLDTHAHTHTGSLSNLLIIRPLNNQKTSEGVCHCVWCVFVCVCVCVRACVCAVEWEAGWTDCAMPATISAKSFLSE